MGGGRLVASAACVEAWRRRQQRRRGPFPLWMDSAGVNFLRGAKHSSTSPTTPVRDYYAVLRGPPAFGAQVVGASPGSPNFVHVRQLCWL